MTLSSSHEPQDTTSVHSNISKVTTTTSTEQRSKHEISVETPAATSQQSPHLARVDTETNEGGSSNRPVDKQTYLRGSKLVFVSTAFSLAGIMMAIDGSILATAIPSITSDFNSVNDVGWYASAYLLAQMSLQPTMGRVYLHFEAKLTFLVSLFVFEGGSIICPTAVNSSMLILGRAVAGAAAAGLLTGNLAVFGQVVPLRNRPRGMAIMTALNSVASLIGPPVGGVITDSSLGWRFCFWINLPVGAAAAVIVILVLDKKPGKFQNLPFLEKIVRLNFSGATVLIASLVLLFLGLQWGGSTVPWSNAQVWGCLLGFALLCSVFIFLQAHEKERATIPLRLLQQRTIAICDSFSGFYGVAIVAQGYLLPIWFQGVRGTNAALSGLYTLPFAITNVIFILISGCLMTVTGYYVPLMWTGSLVYIAGSALYAKLQPTSDAAWYISMQVLAGAGCGMSIQVTFIAVQVVTSSTDLPTVCGLEILFRQLGGAVGISIAESIFLNNFHRCLQDISGIDRSVISQFGLSQASWSSDQYPPAVLDRIESCLNTAITRALLLPVSATAIAAIVGVGMERRRINDDRTIGRVGDGDDDQASDSGPEKQE